MTTTYRRVALALSLSTLGCNEPSWEQENLINSLRVLGVRAEPASLTPGQSAALSVLCVDGTGGGKTDPTCNVEVAWFGHCDNPKDNDPSLCFKQYGKWANNVGKPLAELDLTAYDGAFVLDSTYRYTAPSDVLQQSITVSGKRVRYGNSYVYYAVCAGRLYMTRGSSDRLPVECRDRKTGQVLDQRRFVVGRTTLYSYDVLRNPNPEIEAISFDGTNLPLTPCTTNTDCDGKLECHGDGVCSPVVPPCQNGNDPNCRDHSLGVTLTDESFYPQGLDGSRIKAAEKSLWANYYANAGEPLDDDSFGLAPTSQAQGKGSSALVYWRAPTYATAQARLWLVVRDDRGGQAWHVQPVIVR